MKNSNFIEEDWEMESQKDIMFLLEKEKDEELEYLEWVEKNRKPAIITVEKLLTKRKIKNLIHNEN